ncbi:hypothetical protein CASFOL_019499 [Castilleja foliolosa]|uniref:X8 domain-containing protein n=1 Tax=Castilleja foliolosa TaxID=1961234 RepID=A0ABD3D4I3_9LAMI
MIIPTVYVVIIYCLLTSMIVNGAIGLNWGRENAQRLLPSTVVDILLQNNVPQARIYTSQPDILQAFCGSGINLTISILNIKAITNDTDIQSWVQKNVKFFGPANIRRVYIGNYVYDKINPQINLFEAHLKAVKAIQAALNSVGYADHIKVNLPLSHNILKDNITRPSDADFRDDLKPLIKETIRHLADKGAPFVLQMFPILYITENKLDPDFAFVGGGSRHVVRDVGGAVYTNVFEFMYDSIVWALEKAGAPSDMEVVVGHVGWPTDGYPGANTSTAERFFKGFLPFVKSNKGTPKRPGRSIDTYLHSLTDEPKNSAQQPPFSRHWGIFRSNGEPKYKIDLSGQGRDIYPAKARGIQRMPDRWCMFNGDMTNVSRVKEQVAKACDGADCTAMAPGGSCSNLNFMHNVSYAFNMFFQSKFQDERECWFEGFARVVSDVNPSTGTCVFPVEVVKGEQMNFGDRPSDGERLHHGSRAILLFFVLLISIHWIL